MNKEPLPFRAVFISVLIGGAIIVSSIIINKSRPHAAGDRPGPEFTRAEGKCAQCHRRETSAVVNQFERSKHAGAGVTCYDCHRTQKGQNDREHNGFQLTETVTAKNCAQCHTTEYNQFLRSRHAAPAWAAVRGSQDFTQEQIEASEKYHKGAVLRKANKLALLEGPSSIRSGCIACHNIGAPNPDGSIGSCTQCHSRHSASVKLARLPETCGQCHMGPDHSQLEIYSESKHGVLFNAQREDMNLTAAPKRLSTKDMPVPTCATCHMSGLEGEKVTHDTTERLSYWLFAPNSKKRPTYAQGQNAMKEICMKCHAKKHVDRFYTEAEAVVTDTNKKVAQAKAIMTKLREQHLLTPEAFDEKLEFMFFDYWHYYGRTAKHGAFMGGADFVQWHGNYELLKYLTDMQAEADDLREKRNHGPRPDKR